MTPATWLLVAVAFLVAVSVITVIIDRFQDRRRVLGRFDWRSSEREIDILKDAQILPWRTD